MRHSFRLAIAFVALLLLATAAAAQSLQWSVAPNGPNGYPVRAAFDPLRNRHHIAALDPAGNLFIAGYYYSAPSFPNPEVAGAFLGKYNADTGAEAWRVIGPVPSSFNAVAVNAGGDAFVAGYYVSDTREHQYVARISGATGAIVWEVRGVVQDAANATETYAHDIVLDAAGNPVVLGSYQGRALVTKYDPNTGAPIWSVSPSLDVSNSQNTFGIEADADGNVVGLTYYGDATLGQTPGSLLFKLDASGNRVWAVQWPWRIAATPEVQALTLDGAGKPILVGKGIAKFSNLDGSLIWQRTLRDDNTTSFVYDATTDDTGDVFVTGAEDSQLQVVATAKYRSSDGQTKWHARLQGSSSRTNQAGRSITLDTNRDVLVAARSYHDGSSTDFEIETLNYSNDGVLIYMDQRYPGSNVGGGPADAHLILHHLQHAYTIGTVLRNSDGATVTVALRYAEQLGPRSTTQFSASPNPAPLGAPVTMTAVVSGGAGTPTGTVDFKDGSTPIAGCTAIPLSNGTASCSVSNLSPGLHTLWGIYSGDAVYSGSGARQDETIQNNQAAISLASSANPSQFEQPVTFTASVTGSVGTPTGTVTFFDGTPSPYGQGIYGCTNVPLSGGSASCTMNGLMPGTHAISAKYSGDPNYDPATSSTLNQTVQGSISSASLAWQASNTQSPSLSLDTTANNVFNITPRSAVDSAGNLYFTATTTTSDGTTSCLVVIKLSANGGAQAWRHETCGAWGTIYSAAIAVDSAGNALVTGQVASTAYVAKLSTSTGAPMWEHPIAGWGTALGIGLDSSGNARVVTYTGGSAGGPIAVFGMAGTDGSVQWQRTLNTVMGGKAQDFAVGADGSSVIYERHQIDTKENFNDVITRIDPFGSVVWAVTEPGGESGLVIDAQGNTIGSSFNGLVKRDAATGNVVWRQSSFGGTSVIDAQGNVYVGGTSYDGGSHANLFFAKIDASGNVAWTRLLESATTANYFAAIALDVDGNPVAVAESAVPSATTPASQLTIKLSAASGHVMWIASYSNASGSVFPNNVFGTTQGVLTFGAVRGGTYSSPQGIYAALYSHDAAAPRARKARVDFNGDGKGDLTWINAATGAQGVWLMNGTSAASFAAESAGPGFVMKLLGDFDGDGKTDIVYRGADGTYKVQLMDGTSVKSEAVLLNGGTGWEIVGKGDFDGDGKTDLLWKAANGTYGLWLMNGTTFSSAGLFQAPGPGWDSVIVADFDGDGKSDILWQNLDGRVQMWLMNGFLSTAQADMVSVANGWTPTFAGDFNGDGKADLLWKHADGRIGLWLVNGTTITSYNVMLGANSGWSVVGVGDLDGDGKSDILLRHANGTVGEWNMDGATIRTYGVLPGIGIPVTLDDFDGDGTADIVWKDGTNAHYISLMQGGAPKATATLLNGGTSWQVLN